MGDREIIGTGGSVINIVDLLGNTVTSIQALRKEQKEADIMFISLSAQLTALRAAFIKIKDWTETDLADQHHYLVMNLDVAVSCSRMLIGEVDACVSDLRKKDNEGSVEFSQKVKLTFSKRSIQDLRKMVQTQTKGLTFIIEACNCNSIAEQKSLLEKPGTLKVFRRVQYDSESLVCLRDSDSFISRCTDGLSKLSIVFEFDHALFISKVYEKWLRGSVKKSLRQQQQEGDDAASEAPPEQLETAPQIYVEGVPLERSSVVNLRSMIKKAPLRMNVKIEALKHWPLHDHEAEERKTSKAIDRALEEDSRRLTRECKVLLLGTSDSGKSELVKNMKLLHQGGYDEYERESHRLTIYKTLVDSARALVEAMNRFNIYPDTPENQEYVTFLEEYKVDLHPESHKDARLGVDFGMAMNSLWNDPCVARLMEHSNEFHLMDSAPYFFDEARRIADPEYVPLDADVVRAQTKTNGIYETRFQMGQLIVHLCDFADQRSELRKWIHHFENVTSILFIVDLSCYDQVFLEDSSQNGIMQQLVLFDSAVNNRWSTHTSIIMFLNNVDKFKAKLGISPLVNYFPDYSGGNDVNRAAKYILWRFNQLNRTHLNLYPHLTQSSDTSNLRLVFAALKETILQNALRANGDL